MRGSFEVSLALREARTGARRIGVFMLAIALGVGALTGLHAFQADAAAGARSEARALLGGDVRVQAGNAFGPGLEAVIDSIEASGIPVSRSISLGSMVSAVDGSGARLLQLIGVDPLYPHGSEPRATPEDAWDRLGGGGVIAADRTTLQQLEVEVGDSLRVGTLVLPVSGAVSGLPIDPGIQTIVGPPVFLALSDLEAAGLLTEGSLAQYRASLLVPENQNPLDVARHLQERIGELDEDYARLSVRTAQEEAEALAEGFQALSRFLGLSAFIALLLGGVGVAGAIQLYVEERLPGIAVLRCLGARQSTIFRSYLLQAALLGAGGAVVGVVFGVLLQWGLPALLASVLPFRFDPGFRPLSMVLGLTVGIGVTVLFALFPLLRVREVPPLAALRIDVEGASGRSRSARLLVGGALAVGVLLLAIFQTGGILEGAALTGGLVLVLLVLRGIAALLMWGVRGVLTDSVPFAIRQGVSGLFRPGNQTAVMLTALGFGAFLISSLFVVSSGLRDWLSVELSEDAPALFLFDVQSDQRDGVEALLARFGAPSDLFPVVPARLESIEGVGVEALALEGEIPGWTLRRVYRNTWSGELQSGDRITEGEWWDADHGEDRDQGAAPSSAGPVRISLEADLARQLRVGLGSRVVWDVQGRSVESVITSLREVDWTRFQPNFFAVFEPGSLEGAPASWIGLAPLVEEEARVALQQELVREFPNVSFLDLSAIRETVLRVSGQVTRLLGGMALVAVAGGFLVVAATLLSGRFRRRRESAILRTLGSSGGTLRVILAVEYLALGGLGGAAGVGLGALGGAAVLRFAFELPVTVPLWSLLGIWGVLVLLTLSVGWTSGGPVIRSTPRAVLGSAEG